MTRLVFLDTETTGLALDADIWEVAAIVRDPGRDDLEVHFFVDHAAYKLDALPERFRADHDARFQPAAAHSQLAVSLAVQEITRGAHIVGAVPNFDTERLAIMLTEHSLAPEWHYHLIDVEALAVGYLSCLAGQVDGLSRTALKALGLDPDVVHLDEAVRAAIGPPWRSDDLSLACGVEPPGEGVRHTAMGDARWARDLYDAVTGGRA
jgi:hypothetical protein